MDDYRDELENEELKRQELEQQIINEEVEEPINSYPAYDEKPKKSGGFKRFLSTVAVALVVSILGGYFGANLAMGNRETVVTQASPRQAITINATDEINAVAAVAAKSTDAVVGITTTETRQTWFAEQDVTGVGSGVIVDEKGYILTNSHVVADGRVPVVKVLLSTGETIDGKVLWNDSLLDLAVVKVEKQGLPVAELGDSENLIVGELAIAIGNPLGLDFDRSVTAGVISGLNRSVRVDNTNIIENLIQTDASINRGNSGGPLLNAQGEVIGINTAKIGNAEGLGFSIPINQVKPILAEIIETGNFQNVYMGIKGVSLEEYEQRLNVDLAADSGVVIIEVLSNSPASRAGILPGDVVTAIDDTQVATMNQLKRTLYKYKPEQEAKVDVMRNQEKVELNIKFELGD